MRLAEITVEECRGHGAVIDHVGAVDNRSAVRLARHAGRIGCDAVSSLLPNYVTQFSVEGMLDYYKALSDASGLPVLVYCKGVPDPYGFMEKVMRVDGLIGCKYTMFDYYSMHRICELNGGDINVINGPDEMLLCGLAMGADGGIGSTYNLMAESYLKLYQAFREGRFAEAQEIQFAINRVITVLLRHDCIPAIKETFQLMGYDAGSAAWPGKTFSPEEREALKRELIGAGFDVNSGMMRIRG